MLAADVRVLAVAKRVSSFDLQATVLHVLGLDHTKLTANAVGSAKPLLTSVRNIAVVAAEGGG